MKQLIFLVVCAVCAGMNASAWPGAGGEGHGKMKGGEARMEHMARKLELTGEQQKALQVLREEAKESMRPLQQQLHESRMNTAELIASDDASDEEIMRSVVAEGAAYLALSKARTEHQLKVRNLIGAEKARELVEMRRDRQEQRREQWGREGHQAP